MADQKKNRKKVLIASCILAALIVGSSSFAWFNSQDEVVNKLSASNGYDVAIVEDFTPPVNWTPGQTVQKAVKVTNTGNVDAFVRMSLENKIKLTKKEATGDSMYDENHKDSYIKLGEVTDSSNIPDKIKSLKAGGRLVYCDDGAFNEGKIRKYYYDSTDHTPSSTGFFIFERSNAFDGNGNDYVGYYYLKGPEGSASSVGTYYAITTETDDNGNLIGYSIDKTKSSVVIPTIKYIPADTENNKPAYIKAATPDNSIVININLNATELAKWTVDGTKADELTDELRDPSFYYNLVLEAGQTTKDPLISSLQLDSKVTKDAFIDMEYNLKVKVDSAQVVDNRVDNETNAVTVVNGQGWPMKATFNAHLSASKNDHTVSWAKPSTT
ncbi:MAG: BsaA family SipW-dependent biofilm matrix protein [Acutalibacteraceae bacterium]